jgi:hypothetical protein
VDGTAEAVPLQKIIQQSPVCPKVRDVTQDVMLKRSEASVFIIGKSRSFGCAFAPPQDDTSKNQA